MLVSSVERPLSVWPSELQSLGLPTSPFIAFLFRVTWVIRLLRRLMARESPMVNLLLENRVMIWLIPLTTSLMCRVPLLSTLENPERPLSVSPRPPPLVERTRVTLFAMEPRPLSALVTPLVPLLTSSPRPLSVCDRLLASREIPRPKKLSLELVILTRLWLWSDCSALFPRRQALVALQATLTVPVFTSLPSKTPVLELAGTWHLCPTANCSMIPLSWVGLNDRFAIELTPMFPTTTGEVPRMLPTRLQVVQHLIPWSKTLNFPRKWTFVYVMLTTVMVKTLTPILSPTLCTPPPYDLSLLVVYYKGAGEDSVYCC